MNLNHKNTPSIWIYCIGLSWVFAIVIGIWAWDVSKKYERSRLILREYFDREIAKSKVLQLFEPQIHNRVLNNLFEEWLKNKNTNVLMPMIKP